MPGEIPGNQQYLEVASSTCDWILSLPREETKSGTCLSYVAFKQSSIHNSNMLGAALLARVGKLTGHQHGSGNRRKMRWCIVAPGKIPTVPGSTASRPNTTGLTTSTPVTTSTASSDTFKAREIRILTTILSRGFAYFKNHFVEADGKPKYYHNQTYPIDIQCAAQAIDTLSPSSPMTTARPSPWPAKLPTGRLTTCRLATAISIIGTWDGESKTPMFHWGQATMFKALAHLAAKLNAVRKMTSPGKSSAPIAAAS